jgi:hypothetical protein
MVSLGKSLPEAALPRHVEPPLAGASHDAVDPATAATVVVEALDQAAHSDPHGSLPW